ncbi:MAG TPA: hypothetical protein VKU36_03840 [Candidatus Babeliales bacterium]|nr:hypothetical protein [Candidatus Babeliales bacterium]
MNKDLFSHDSTTQFALSYELLHLLRWLGEHDTEKLKKIISKAVTHGLHDNIQKATSLANPRVLEEMHHGIVDFFDLLDSLLSDAINTHVEQKAREKNLLPTIDHLDSSLLDSEMLRCSVEKATKKLDTNPHINPKEQLCKELLKQWKPVNKENIH